jgi:hypothetical protein
MKRGRVYSLVRSLGREHRGYVRWKVWAVLYSILKYGREEVKLEEEMNVREPSATNKFAFTTSGILFKHIGARLPPICCWPSMAIPGNV